MIDNRRKGLGLAHTAFALLAAPAAALAQVSTTPSPAVAPPADGSSVGLVGVVGALIALIVAIGIAVKLYDAKRKREEQAVALQARLSDTLLLHPSLAGMPVVASVHMPLWRGSPPVVEVKGTVLNQTARDIALHVVQRELDGINARIEDQIVIDPRAVRHVAA